MLTADQIAQFHRDGFLIIRGVFAGRELAELRQAADAVMAEGVAGRGEHHATQTNLDGQKVYFRSEKMWERQEIFRAATVNPTLLECIGQCYGHPFMPVNDSFVCKIPRGNLPIGWHQDPPYNNAKALTSSEVPNFDTDIYLDQSTIENGCVWGIPGHHLVGHVELEKYSQEELFTKFGAVPMVMEPGDVLFHTISGPHGSAGNKTATARRIFYVHYMPQEILDTDYAHWFAKRRGTSPEGLALIRGMIESRRRLGLDGLDGRAIRFTDQGFVFSGQPATPPRHWRTLMAAIPEERKGQMKRLAAVARGKA